MGPREQLRQNIARLAGRDPSEVEESHLSAIVRDVREQSPMSPPGTQEWARAIERHLQPDRWIQVRGEDTSDLNELLREILESRFT